MLTLDLSNVPRWHDLAPGVRLQLRPLTTTLMVATRSDPDVEAVPDGTSDETRALIFAKAPVRRAVLDWEGVGDSDGNVIDPSPQTIDALLDIWPIFEAFQLAYARRVCSWSRKKMSPRPRRLVFRRRRQLLRSLHASLRRLPDPAEPAADLRGLAGLGSGRAAWRSTARAAGRSDRLGSNGRAGLGGGAGHPGTGGGTATRH